MPSQQPFRTPVWLPIVIIAVAAVAVVMSVMHLSKRVKAQWPW